MNQETHPRLNITKNPELLHSSPGCCSSPKKERLQQSILNITKNPEMS